MHTTRHLTSATFDHVCRTLQNCYLSRLVQDLFVTAAPKAGMGQTHSWNGCGSPDVILVEFQCSSRLFPSFEGLKITAPPEMDLNLPLAKIQCE